MDIAFIGMSYSDWLLAARVSGGPNPLFWVKRDVVPEMQWLYVVPVSTGIPVLVTSSPIPAANPHFPWGNEVFPD
jgi:hypothetical protein